MISTALASVLTPELHSTGPTLRIVEPSTGTDVQDRFRLPLQPLLAPPALVVSPGNPSSDWIEVPVAVRSALAQWTSRHLQAVVEIAAGDRPASQLVRHCSPQVHQDPTRRALLSATAGGWVAGAGRPDGALRPHVVSTRLQVIAHDCYEASAHVRHGPRSRAVAARFEHRRNRWMAVALEFA